MTLLEVVVAIAVAVGIGVMVGLWVAWLALSITDTLSGWL